MDVELIEEEESEEEIVFPTSIDTLIYVAQIEKVIIVDLTNGLFVVELNTKNQTAVIKPFFELDVTTFHRELRQNQAPLCLSLHRS